MGGQLVQGGVGVPPFHSYFLPLTPAGPGGVGRGAVAYGGREATQRPSAGGQGPLLRRRAAKLHPPPPPASPPFPAGAAVIRTAIGERGGVQRGWKQPSGAQPSPATGLGLFNRE